MAAIPEVHPSLPAPSPTLRREWLLLGLSLLILICIVIPPLVNLGRYQHRIVDTMSRSLGRPVTMSKISLRLLPTPALVLSDVIVNEDPAFGAEPALRTPSVTAQLRLTSLWRGRFEVSRVEMSEASINLVRNSSGRWNVGSVLLQASHVQNAPTAQRRAGSAPRFPYIEITDSRLNLKQGVEKLPYSLLNVNLSMWLAEPDLWRLRLAAEPVRTDLKMGLSDSGVIRVEGTLHRATALGHMPLALRADWSNAPLGQASVLLLGRDGGWRGDLHATAEATGELDRLAVKTHLAVANLHRQEFTPAEPFAVDATCQAAYSRATNRIGDLACRWPIGSGLLQLTGSVQFRSAGFSPDLTLAAQQLPAGFLVAAAGLASSDVTPIAHVNGELTGTLTCTVGPSRWRVYDGALQSPQLVLDAGSSPLILEDVRIAATSPPGGRATLVLTSAPVDLGGASPAELTAQLTTQGYVLHATGSTRLKRLAELSHAAGLQPVALRRLTAQGSAEFDVTRTSPWQPESSANAMTQADGPASSAARRSITTGWLRLHNAQYTPSFLREPVLLPSAQATFVPGEIDWSAPAAGFHHMPLQITASYTLNCPAMPCPARFHASLSSLDAAELTSALTGASPDSHLVDQLLTRLGQHPSPWPPISGTLHVDTLTLGALALHQADAVLSIEGVSVTLQSLHAKALGGSLSTDGSIHVDHGVPTYALTASLTSASAAASGSLFHEDWGPGSLSLSTTLHLSGVSASELAGSARGSFHANWLHGSLPSATPFAHFSHWSADGDIADSALTLAQSQLTPVTQPRTPGLLVKGHIGFDRHLALQLQRPDDVSTSVTGTIAAPSH